MRCFVAVELPLPMCEEIGRLQSSIATDGLRLVRAELVHVTIKFLGDVPQENVGQVAEALGRVKAAPFPVRPGSPHRVPHDAPGVAYRPSSIRSGMRSWDTMSAHVSRSTAISARPPVTNTTAGRGRRL